LFFDKNMEISQKILIAILSTFFASDYSLVHAYDSYSNRKKAEVVANEVKAEEQEQTKQLKILVDFLEKEDAASRQSRYE
jgi:hypothetical protein